MKILQVVGEKNSGKTYFIEKLVEELKGKYRVATVKHSPFEDYIMDKKGKDSFRHISAGSKMSVFVMRDKIFLFKKIEENFSLKELIDFIKKIGNFDFLIIEGYKEEKYPKIETYRKTSSKSLITSEEELLAVVTDDEVSFSVPVFSFSEVKKIVRFLEENLKDEKSTVELRIDNKKIPLNNFVKDIFRNTIKGMISSLKGTEKEAKKIFLFIEED
jgi:molybdopterin-guanine dinucleotide biosynthesis protein B